MRKYADDEEKTKAGENAIEGSEVSLSRSPIEGLSRQEETGG